MSRQMSRKGSTKSHRKRSVKEYTLEEGLRRTQVVSNQIIDNLCLTHNKFQPNFNPVSYFAQTQCHANVLNLPEAKSGKSKVFWIFVVLLAVTGLIVELIHVMTRYIKSPKASEIEIESVEGLPFPAIVICSLNPLNRSYLREHQISLEVANYAQSVYATMKNDASGGASKNYNASYMHQQLVNVVSEYPNQDLRHFFLRSGYQCNAFLPSCAFQWRSFNCCEVAEELFDIQFGKCFLIDGDQFEQFYPAAGFQIKVHIDKNIAVPSHGPPSRGVAIRVLDEYDPSFTEYTYLGLGKHTAVQLEELNHYYLNTFMKKVCQDIEEMGKDWTSFTSSKYTQNQCIGLCFNQAAIRACNCTYPQDGRMFGKFSVPRMCMPLEAVECLVPQVENSTSVHTCAKSCIPECHQTQYRVSVSTADLFLHPEDDHDHVTAELEDTMILDIFFAKIQRTKIQEIYIVTADGLISQIGGLLGIFLGASLITAVQLIMFCLGFFHRKICELRDGYRLWKVGNSGVNPQEKAKTPEVSAHSFSPNFLTSRDHLLQLCTENGQDLTISRC